MKKCPRCQGRGVEAFYDQTHDCNAGMYHDICSLCGGTGIDPFQKNETEGKTIDSGGK